MSQEHVELVRRVYGGWARGDFSEIEAFHPEIDYSVGIARKSSHALSVARQVRDIPSMPRTLV
jgi:hypothetical protein